MLISSDHICNVYLRDKFFPRGIVSTFLDNNFWKKIGDRGLTSFNRITRFTSDIVTTVCFPPPIVLYLLEVKVE